MNILKIGFVVLTGAFFGFGIDRINNVDSTTFENGYYMHGSFDRCDEDEFLEHMINELNAEDKVIVENKIDGLLSTYNTTLEEVFSNRDLRHDFMEDLMNFMEENNIEVTYNDYHFGPRMH